VGRFADAHGACIDLARPVLRRQESAAAHMQLLAAPPEPVVPHRAGGLHQDAPRHHLSHQRAVNLTRKHNLANVVPYESKDGFAAALGAQQMEVETETTGTAPERRAVGQGQASAGAGADADAAIGDEAAGGSEVEDSRESLTHANH